MDSQRRPIARAKVTAFARLAERRFDRKFPDYRSVYRFSIERPGDFWDAVWDFTGIRGDKGERLVEHLDRMPGARFFPDARLNFTENVLRRRDAAPAIVFNGEHRIQRSLTFAELYSQTCGMAAALESSGRQAGRPRGRNRAQHAGNHRRGARRGGDRRHLVVLLAGLRRAGGSRSVRTDRARRF